MQKLIAWLLAKYTPFRVCAWTNGRIAAIGTPAFVHERMNYWDRRAVLPVQHGIAAPTILTEEILRSL